MTEKRKYITTYQNVEEDDLYAEDIARVECKEEPTQYAIILVLASGKGRIVETTYDDWTLGQEESMNYFLVTAWPSLDERNVYNVNHAYEIKDGELVKKGAA